MGHVQKRFKKIKRVQASLSIQSTVLSSTTNAGIEGTIERHNHRSNRVILLTTTSFYVSFTMCLFLCVCACVCMCVMVCLVSKHWKAVKSSWAQRWRTVLRAWTCSAQWPWPSLTAPRWTPRTGTSSSRGKPRTANGRWELQAHTCQVHYSPSRS